MRRQPLSRNEVERKDGKWLMCVLLISDRRREPLMQASARSVAAAYRRVNGDVVTAAPTTALARVAPFSVIEALWLQRVSSPH
jgi:hypothetical protein